MTPRHAYVVSKYFFGQQKFSTSRQSEQHDGGRGHERADRLPEQAQGEGGAGGDMQEAKQGLDEAMRDNANMEKIC